MYLLLLSFDTRTVNKTEIQRSIILKTFPLIFMKSIFHFLKYSFLGVTIEIEIFKIFLETMCRKRSQTFL